MPHRNNLLLQKELLTEAEFAEFMTVSQRTAQNWRQKGNGPKHLLITSKKIRYKPADILAWLETKLTTDSSKCGDL